MVSFLPKIIVVVASLLRRSLERVAIRASEEEILFCSPSGSSFLRSSSFHPEKNRKKIDDADDDDHKSALLKADGFGTSTTLQRRRGARAKVLAITKEEDSGKNDDDALSDDQPRWSGEPSRADANATEIETTTTTAITQPPATTSGYTRKWKKRDLSWARDAIPFYVMLLWTSSRETAFWRTRKF